MKSALAYALLVPLVLAGLVYARNEQQQLSESDQLFLQKAAQANIAEVQAGQLAAAKATRGDLKAFGRDMVQAHSTALRDAQSLASKKGVALPNDVDEAHRAELTALSRASGREFDLTYVNGAGVADHKAAKDLFESGTKSTDNDVRAFARKMLPTVEHHLAMAEKLQDK